MGADLHEVVERAGGDLLRAARRAVADIQSRRGGVGGAVVPATEVELAVLHDRRRGRAGCGLLQHHGIVDPVPQRDLAAAAPGIVGHHDQSAVEGGGEADVQASPDGRETDRGRRDAVRLPSRHGQAVARREVALTVGDERWGNEQVRSARPQVQCVGARGRAVAGPHVVLADVHQQMTAHRVQAVDRSGQALDQLSLGLAVRRIERPLMRGVETDVVDLAAHLREQGRGVGVAGHDAEADGPRGRPVRPPEHGGRAEIPGGAVSRHEVADAVDDGHGARRPGVGARYEVLEQRSLGAIRGPQLLSVRHIVGSEQDWHGSNPNVLPAVPTAWSTRRAPGSMQGVPGEFRSSPGRRLAGHGAEAIIAAGDVERHATKPPSLAAKGERIHRRPLRTPYSQPVSGQVEGLHLRCASARIQPQTSRRCHKANQL